MVSLLSARYLAPVSAFPPPVDLIEQKQHASFDSCSSWLLNSGISARQGGHQLAQKFRMTTLPLKSLSRTVSPPLPTKAKSWTAIRGSTCTAWAKAALLRPAAAKSTSKDKTTNFSLRISITSFCQIYPRGA